MARASLEELRLDYEDFLRQRGLVLWDPYEPLGRELVKARCKSADDVAAWIRGVRDQTGQTGRIGQTGPSGASNLSSSSSSSSYPALAANAALVLINVACALLDRQLAVQAEVFETEGGFTERLYRTRKARRGK